MVRWQPGTLERLQQAAIELFEERGYDGTTVADIAARAGLTERTFYRHYPDKREILVAGSAELAGLLTGTIVSQPADVTPLLAVAAALEAVGGFFDDRREFVLRRQAVIRTSGDLQERELAKIDALTGALATTLQSRGASRSEAVLAATVGVGIFHVAFGQWVADPDRSAFSDFVRRVFAQLRGALADARPAPVP